MRSGSTMPRQKKLSDSGKHVASVIHPAVTGPGVSQATLLTQVSQWLVPADWRMNAQQRLHNRWAVDLITGFQRCLLFRLPESAMLALTAVLLCAGVPAGADNVVRKTRKNQERRKPSPSLEEDAASSNFFESLFFTTTVMNSANNQQNQPRKKTKGNKKKGKSGAGRSRGGSKKGSLGLGVFSSAEHFCGNGECGTMLHSMNLCTSSTTNRGTRIRVCKCDESNGWQPAEDSSGPTCLPPKQCSRDECSSSKNNANVCVLDGRGGFRCECGGEGWRPVGFEKQGCEEAAIQAAEQRCQHDECGTSLDSENICLPNADSIASYKCRCNSALHFVRAIDQYNLEYCLDENRPPAMTSVLLQGMAAVQGRETLHSLQTSFVDPDGDALSISLASPSGLPPGSGMRFDPIGQAISGSPNEIDLQAAGCGPTAAGHPTASCSPLRINLLVSDGRASVQQSLMLLMVPRNSPPLSRHIPPQSITQGQPADLPLGQYFEDPDGDNLAFFVAGLPRGSGLTIDFATGTIIGSPSPADVAMPQPLSLLVMATDGTDKEGQSTQPLLLTIQLKPGGNAAPISQPLAPLAATLNVPFVTDISYAFTDIDSPKLDFFIAGLPQGSGFALYSSGKLRGTPSSADADAEQPLTLQIAASDGQATSVQPLLIYVAASGESAGASRGEAMGDCGPGRRGRAQEVCGVNALLGSTGWLTLVGVDASLQCCASVQLYTTDCRADTNQTPEFLVLVASNFCGLSNPLK